MLTFQKGTKLILTDGVSGYEFLVGSATANQTFKEVVSNPKTMQNNIQIQESIVTEKINASLDFSVTLTKDHTLKVLEWFGMVRDGLDSAIIQVATPSSSISTSWDIYIDAGNTIYKIDSVVAENFSLSISRKELLSANITALGVNLVEVSSIPTFADTFTQNPNDFLNRTITVQNFSSVSDVTFEITRSIRWLAQKSIQQVLAKQIYTSDVPILTELSVSGSITRNKKDSTNQFLESTPIRILYGDAFEIFLSSCNTTDRWQMSSIHRLITDYKMLPNSANSFIKF